MSRVEAALQKFEHDPRRGSNADLKLSSTVSAPSDPEEIERAWTGERIPVEAIEFWSVCRAARLYIDIDDGLWGLELLSPDASAGRTWEAREQTARFRDDDIVVGAFVGDGELLGIAPSEPADRRILISDEIGPRREWFAAADSLGTFLEKYFEAASEKYWEPRPRKH